MHNRLASITSKRASSSTGGVPVHKRFCAAYLFGVLLAPMPIGASAQATTPAANTVCDPDTHETADQVYARAIHRWEANTYPTDQHYTLHIALESQRGPIDLHYDGHAQPYRDLVTMDDMSAEERSAPSTPHGINAILTVQGSTIFNFTRQRDPYDVIGQPLLSPFYSFGMVSAHRSSDDDVSPGVSSLRVIGRAAVHGRTYDVACIDSDFDVAGRRIDHISLTPLRRPNDNRLRELWIESDSGWTDQALISRNFVDGPPLHCRWKIAFSHDGGIEYIKSETALGALDYGVAGVFREARLTFELQPRKANVALDAFVFIPPEPEDEHALLREPQVAAGY